jgi:hypothetical protein
VPANWITEGVSPEAEARASFYNVSLLPTNMFDGVVRVEAGTYASYLAAYNNRRNVPSPLKIDFLARSYSQNKASVKARITLDQDISAGAVCHIILWEDKANYNGHDWRFVERKMYPADALTVTKKGQSQTFKREFTLNAGWNKARLGATVIVQRPATKAILNGRAAKLVEGVSVTPASLGRVKALFE